MEGEEMGIQKRPEGREAGCASASHGPLGNTGQGPVAAGLGIGGPNWKNPILTSRVHPELVEMGLLFLSCLYSCISSQHREGRE